MAALCIVLIAACVFPLSRGQRKHDTQGQPALIDSGRFGIYLNGKRIGSETFKVEQQAGEGILTAEIAVEDGTARAEQSSELRVGADGGLKSYKWRSTSPTKEESSIEPRDELLMERFTTANRRTRDVPYVLPLSTIILDDNFFSQREFLVWRYLATGCTRREDQLQCGRTRYGILVPHQHTAGSTTVELVGRDKLSIKGAERELNKVKAETDGVQWLLWVDDPENGYKIIKISIPSVRLEVLRE